MSRAHPAGVAGVAVGVTVGSTGAGGPDSSFSPPAGLAWSYVSLPQHTGTPFSRSAQVCAPPGLIDKNVSSDSVGSCHELLVPQHTAEPSMRSPHAWLSVALIDLKTSPSGGIAPASPFCPQHTAVPLLLRPQERTPPLLIEAKTSPSGGAA